VENKVDVSAEAYASDLSTLKGHADTLGVPLKMVLRHAIRLGLTTTSLTTEIDVNEKTLATLDSDAAS